MSRRGRRQQPPPTRGAVVLPESPSLTELERFTDQTLRQYRRGWEAFNQIYRALWFGLEQQRAQYAADITDALRSNAAAPLAMTGWGRIVNTKFALTPLSIAGSLSGDGGRFNIGRGLNEAVFTPFGALYVADAHATAFAEKFGIREDESRDGLSASELVLRAPTSYQYVVVEGYVERCFDAADVDALKAVAAILQHFKMPDQAHRAARAIQRVPPHLVRSAAPLRQQLLEPNWNRLPTHFDLPSNSQVFGRMVRAAGYHGIVYPSQRVAGGRCVALFLDNWKGSDSFVRCVDEPPPGSALTAHDGTSTVFM